jgi:hypothetical protein
MTRRSTTITLTILASVLGLGTCACCLWQQPWGPGWGGGVGPRPGGGVFWRSRPRAWPMPVPAPWHPAPGASRGGSSRSTPHGTASGRGGFGSSGSGHVGS